MYKNNMLVHHPQGAQLSMMDEEMLLRAEFLVKLSDRGMFSPSPLIMWPNCRSCSSTSLLNCSSSFCKTDAFSF